MSDDCGTWGRITSTYDPDPIPLLPTDPGVTPGYVVMRTGEPGDAQIAKAALLVDLDGESSIEITSAFEPTRIIDDGEAE